MFYWDPKSRRQFLLLAGKTALAIPILPSLLASKAMAQSRPPGALVMVNMRNGVFPENWQTRTTGLTQVSDPSQPWTTIRQAPFSSSPSGDINDVFTAAITGSHINNMLHLQGLDQVNPSGHADNQLGFANGNPTADQIAAGNLAATYANVPPPINSLEINNPGPLGSRSASYRVGSSGGAMNLPALSDPTAIYDRIFGLSNGASRTSILESLDLASAESTRVSNRALAREDKDALARYFQLLRELHTRVTNLPPLTCNIPARPTGNYSDLTALADIQTTLAAVAVACGVRVVTFYIQSAMSTNNSVYDAQRWHSASHEPTNSVPEFLAAHRWVAQNYYMAMVQKLDQLGVAQDSMVGVRNDIWHGGTHLNDVNDCVFYMGQNVPGITKRGRFVSYMRVNDPGLKIPQFSAYFQGILENQLFNTLLNGLGLSVADYRLPGELGFGVTQFASQDRRSRFTSVLPGRDKPLPWIGT